MILQGAEPRSHWPLPNTLITMPINVEYSREIFIQMNGEEYLTRSETLNTQKQKTFRKRIPYDGKIVDPCSSNWILN